MLDFASKSKLNFPVPLACISLAFLLLVACGAKNEAETPSPSQKPNTLTTEEKAAGWRLLFNGENLTGWRGIGIEGTPEGHWIIENGAIK